MSIREVQWLVWRLLERNAPIHPAVNSTPGIVNLVYQPPSSMLVATGHLDLTFSGRRFDKPIHDIDESHEPNCQGDRSGILGSV